MTETTKPIRKSPSESVVVGETLEQWIREFYRLKGYPKKEYEIILTKPRPPRDKEWHLVSAISHHVDDHDAEKLRKYLNNVFVIQRYYVGVHQDTTSTHQVFVIKLYKKKREQ